MRICMIYFKMSLQQHKRKTRNNPTTIISIYNLINWIPIHKIILIWIPIFHFYNLKYIITFDF